MPSQRPLALDTLKGGAVLQLFDTCMQKVLENIDDPNMPAEKVREITIKIKIKPSETRQSGIITAGVEAKLAQGKGVASTVFFGLTPEGHVASEYDPSQVTIEEAIEKGQRLADERASEAADEPNESDTDTDTATE